MKYDCIVIGGGASGMAVAAAVRGRTLVIERNERLGKKLSATGNGQGNVTNLNVAEDKYFTSGGKEIIADVIKRYDCSKIIEFLSGLGGIYLADVRGRVYPSSRQASSVTDVFRFYLNDKNVESALGQRVEKIKKIGDVFEVTTTVNKYVASNVALCAGGKAAKNFGTDGNGYILAESLGHTLAPQYPSLVQLKTDMSKIKGLKGIKVAASVRCCGVVENGDVLFTEYGVSGDAIFRISAYRPSEINIDLLPSVSKSDLVEAMRREKDRPLCAIVNNQIANSVIRRVGNDIEKIANEIKSLNLTVLGTLGFDYAQVTKGGVRLAEVNNDLMSKKQNGLYFCGEILDVDGLCGGYNLHWAFASALRVARSINENLIK